MEVGGQWRACSSWPALALAEAGTGSFPPTGQQPALLSTVALGRHLGVVAKGQRGDLLRVAKPVLLGTRVQVLHHHQAAAGIGKEPCSRENASQAPEPSPCQCQHCAGSHRQGCSSRAPLEPPADGQHSFVETWPGMELGPALLLFCLHSWAYLCLASRPCWPARSHCSPPRFSGVAARHPREGRRCPEGSRHRCQCPAVTWAWT